MNMNHKLPFALSALGLISLAIHQPVMAQLEILPPKQSTAPSLTIELASGEVQPPPNVLNFDGVPLRAIDGSFVITPTATLPSSVTVTSVITDTNGEIYRRFLSIESSAFEANLEEQLFEHALDVSLTPGVTISKVELGTEFVEASNGRVLESASFLAAGLPGPAGLTATPSSLSNSVIVNSFVDPSSVTASTTDALVGAAVENAAAATLATSANAISTAATINQQLAQQSIATGEDSIAVAALATTTEQTVSTATVEDSLLGVRIDGNGTLSGATSVTVDGNSLSATARANDSSSALTATGANSGAAGNSASSPDNDATYPAPGALTLNGDLLATGVQRLDLQSDVTASVIDSRVGLASLNDDGTLDAITGGAAVTGNGLSATADGNRLSLSLTDNLSGGDVDSTAYALQTVNDTSITANANGAQVGVEVGVINGSSLVIDNNSVQAAAAGNRTTATVTARPDGAADSVLLDAEQFVRAETSAVNISATALGSVIGRTGDSSSAVNTSVASNRLTAVALGNEQASTVDLGSGVQAGVAQVEGNQTLVLAGNDLSIVAGLTSSRIGTLVDDGNDADAVTSVTGNTAIAQSVGNLAGQTLGDSAGNREATLLVSQNQTATGAAANTLLLGAGLLDLGIGVAGVGQSFQGPQVTVADNQAASLVSLNRNSQTVGVLSGSANAAGTVSIDATQSADSVSAGTAIAGLRIGVVAADDILAGTAAAADFTVTGNQATAQVELNRSLQSLGGVSGSLGGAVELSTTQTANAAAGGLSAVEASQIGTGLGFTDNTGNIDVADGRFGLVVSGNELSTQAQANLAQTAIGDVSGSVNLTNATDRLGASISQAATDTAVTASNIDAGLGISNAAPATAPLFTAGTDEVGISVADNSVQSLARINSGSVVTGAIVGQATQGDLRTVVAQSSSGASSASAGNSGVFAGVTPAVAAGDLGLGLASESTTVTVSGNTVRADAADNLATVIAGGVSGTVGATATVGAAITQSSDGSVVNALNTIIDLGAAEQNGFSLGAGTGALSITVADNDTVAVASANNSTASLGGVAGSIATGGTASIATTQSLDNGLVTASTSLVKAGVTAADLGDTAGSGAASLSVAGNTVVTAASGNDSRVVDLGDSAATLDGTLSATVTQTIGANASLGANASNLQIGAADLGDLGTQSAVAVSVDGNTVATSATANNSSVNGSVSGSLGGQIAVSATQTLNGSTSGIAVTSGTATEPNLVGVQAANLGANATVSVADNTVSSAVSANRVLNNLDGAAFANATGSLNFTATQTINGAGVTTGDLRSEVNNSTVGVIGGDGSLLPSAAVSGNRLVASTSGNDATRSLNGLSGNFNAATTALTMTDTQTIDNAVLVANVSNSRVGSQIQSDTAVPSALAINGNAVVAQAIANNSNQQVSLNGVSTRGGPLTSLNASQNLLNSSVRAEISTVTVGFGTLGVTAGAGSFAGSAVSAGNSIGASAIGNQSSQVRRGR